MHATLQYLKKLPIYDEEKPFRIFTNLPPDALDQRYSNLEFEKKEVTIHDIRDQIPAPTLDGRGFEVREWPSSLDVHTIWNKDDVENVYLPELETMLRKKDPSIHRVFFFDWRIRHSDGPGEDSIDINDLATQLSPAEEVHVG
ncbi:methyltransferase CmcJ [Penicillium macrosclerotiorum]|uniref:methyltransferase CmcJ n=1 Tax=Penicillium macrosclerotiorum TaxID=303699 RepID=UPI002547E8C2|nr:methyltransferase CmcJ [Penicillium macrosclerotiorum]KAJ5679789.1 methyltransferase CmcJ [Penicillium macrosclerotiorum]